MPSESKKFETVDRYWRDMMDSVTLNPACLEVSKVDNILSHLVESTKLLDDIQKGLNAYLETKRLYFARFFFLSNDELLEILAETKDPLRVQPFLKKCFDGLTGIEFREDSHEIVAMISPEGERVEMIETINPDDSHGAVERWLLDVERVMRATVKFVLRSAMANYPTQVRNKPINTHKTNIVTPLK